MLFLFSDVTGVSDLSEKHFDRVKCFVRKKVDSKLVCSVSCEICDSKLSALKSVPPQFRRILENEENLRKIILSNGSELEEVQKVIFRQLFPKHSYTSIRDIQKRETKYLKDKKADVVKPTREEAKVLKDFKLLAKIFDYDNWFNKLNAGKDYGPYSLAEGLGIRACTYCNRQYTITVKSKIGKSGKLTRPQFDHWLAKERFPILALSFYNLIPSCETCNSSVKGSIRFQTSSHLHPYVDNFVDHIVFSYRYWSMIDKYEVSVHAKHQNSKVMERINNTLAAFKIGEVYNGHHPELLDLIELSRAYSDKYLDILKKSFPGANLTDGQIYRFAFGVELDSKDFHKRPMSKFKHDVLVQLGIIK